VPVWHQVAAVYRNRPRGGGAPAGEAPGMSRPVSTPARTILPVIAALRADLSGDSVLLSWRPTPGHDEVVIERTFHASSSVQGAMRRFRAARGQFVDGDVQPGATYQYRVWVASEDRAEAAEPTQSAEVTVTAIPRPRAVLDLESRKTLGGVVLGWRTVPGATVRIYATPAGTVPGLAGTGPFGPAGHEVTTGSLEGRARLVGESRRGRLVDQEGGAVVYTPVSVAGDRAVIGTAVHQT
jgi:hypothetical protein